MRTTIVEIMPKSATPATRAAEHRVVLVAYDQLCTFEYSIAAEVFGVERSVIKGSWYGFQTAASEDGPLRAQGGLVVAATGGLQLLEGAGTIIVPGWRGPRHEVPVPLSSALRSAHRAGSRVVSICSGAYVLAAAGLLSGRRATTHWRHRADFAARFPDVRFEPNVLYVDEGDILTSAGSAAGIDLCLTSSAATMAPTPRTRWPAAWSCVSVGCRPRFWLSGAGVCWAMVSSSRGAGR